VVTETAVGVELFRCWSTAVTEYVYAVPDSAVSSVYVKFEVVPRGDETSARLIW